MQEPWYRLYGSSRAEAIDRGGVGAILFIMRGGGAGGEIAVALALVAAQRADALHVAQHQRLGARQTVLIDAEGGEHLRQLVGGMRPVPDQRLQIGGSHPQFARDLAEIGGVHLAHFPQLAPVLQPFAEDVDHAADDGIGLFLNGHGTAPLAEWLKVRANRASVVALDQIWGGMQAARPCFLLPQGEKGRGRSYLPNLSAAHAYRLPGMGFSPPRPLGEMCSPMISGSAISAEKSEGSKNSFGSA